MEKPLFIIIPVYNRKEFTKNCLLSLRSQTVQNFTVVVVDDGSTDGTSELLKAEFPEVVVLYGDGNLWWSASTNLGINFALQHNAEYIMTLNDDTIATENYIEKMFFWVKQKPNALLGAFAVDAVSKKPIYGGEKINWFNAGKTLLLDQVDSGKQFGLHSVSHFPGRGLLIPAKVFSVIGMFDDKHFPQSLADFDFTHRAVKLGFEIFCNFDAKLLIYPQESGDAKLRQKKSWKKY